MTSPDPLPIVDAGSVLQEESVRALQAALPLSEYLFRDERVNDYGVDGSLELRIDGRATNIRAQVQLKGRSNTHVNADGTVSVPVSTSNLNYLLNGICPLYVLYRRESKELRFAVARDEWARLKNVNPTWKEQDSVTIRFRQVLTSESLAELRERILKDAALRRDIDERLNVLRANSGRVTIDAKTLAVTDSQQTLELLSRIGQVLTNSGLAALVIERARAIPSIALRAEPRAALAVAYAHFHLARYYDASATIRELLATEPNLEPSNSALLDVLFISVRRMLGQIDQAQYDQEMRDWASHAPTDLALQYEIAGAWSEYHTAVVSGRPAIEQAAARSSLEAMFDRARSVGGGVLLRSELLELTLRQQQVEDGMIDALAVRDLAEHGVGDAHHARVADRASREEAMRWFEQLTSLANRTQNVAPFVHCEVRLLHSHAVLCRAGQMHLMSLTGHGPPVSKEAIEAIFAGINETLLLARSLEHGELEVRAMQNLARATDLFGRTEEATVLARHALKLAELGGYFIEAKQLRQFVSGEDRIDSRLRQLQEVGSQSEENILRTAADDQLLFRATMVAAALQLPDNRIPNILENLQCHQRVAIERRDWCKHIALAEYRRHHESSVTMFAKPPPLKIVCMLLGYEAPVAPQDAPARISANFRARFCARCTQRDPDSDVRVSASSGHNRAKAERRRRRRKS